MNLFMLPDDLWISVLYEWIGQPISICALDIAFCNYLLRLQYLAWLCQSYYTFGMFSSVDFKTFHEHSRKSIADGFFDWCEKRNIYPASLTYSHRISYAEEARWAGKLSKKALTTMKHVERFYYYFKFNINPVSPSLNVLNECSQLKHLVVNMDTCYTSGFIAFHCEKGPFPLLSLELHTIRLYLSNENFRNLIRACPLLEMVRLKNCLGIHLNHVTYLLNHAKRIKSIHIEFSISFREFQMKEDLMTEEMLDNVSLKSMSLLNLMKTVVSREGVLLSCQMKKLLSILRRCQLQEGLVLDFHDTVTMNAVMAEWSEVVATCSQHLQSFSLHNSNRVMRYDIMNPIYRYCGNQLKRLTLYDVNLNAITVICNTFTALESLELHRPDSLSFQYHAILQLFQEARFRDTLRVFKLNSRVVSNSVSVNDCSRFFDCFPALKVIDMMLSRDISILTPFASIHLIEELNLTGRGFYVSNLPSSIMNRFVKLRKLTLQYVPLTAEVLCSVLTLPNLRYLTLKNLLGFIGINVWFHPANYPADTKVLSPLKEFTWESKYMSYSIREEVIRTFLQRFPSLELYAVEHLAMDAEEFKRLQREYRYRTIITKFVNCS